MKYLLDNNVFFAAIYPQHAAHAANRAWLDSAKPMGWGIAVETYLAAVRLLMNPTLMGAGALTSREALAAVNAELAGPRHRGRLVVGAQKPDPRMLEKASGYRQVMDCWLVQIARDHGVRLATRDAGMQAQWPEYTLKVA